MSETESPPQYISEVRVAAMTGMSRPWLQRARAEGIGPRFFRIGRRVAYKVDDVIQWVESGAAGREHLTSRPKKDA